MTNDEKQAVLKKALEEMQQQEHTAWVNWQVTRAHVECLERLIANLAGAGDESD